MALRNKFQLWPLPTSLPLAPAPPSSLTRFWNMLSFDCSSFLLLDLCICCPLDPVYKVAGFFSWGEVSS